MAYVECLCCGRTVFSAAYWTSLDYCPRCGATLPPRIDHLTPTPRHPRLRSVGSRSGSALHQSSHWVA